MEALTALLDKTCDTPLAGNERAALAGMLDRLDTYYIHELVPAMRDFDARNV